jgi:hypothetical protein
MTDNGLAALTAALWRPYDPPNDRTGQCNVCGDDGIANFEAKDAAAAILGERGVFLPNGLDPFLGEHMVQQYANQAATIATLRAANAEADSIIEKHIIRLARYFWHNGGHIETFANEARAALATAKEI